MEQEVIYITIDGEKVPTTMENGVQMLPSEPLISKLLEAGLIDLNNVKLASMGIFSSKIAGVNAPYLEADRKALYTWGLGYSVSGFQDIYPYSVIENPLWEKWRSNE